MPHGVTLDGVVIEHADIPYVIQRLTIPDVRVGLGKWLDNPVFEVTFRLDTGADINILPEAWMKCFADETFSTERMRDFWLDSKSQELDGFVKKPGMVADGSRRPLPVLITSGTIRIPMPDEGHRDLDNVLFGFNPSFELLERHRKQQGIEGTFARPREVFLIGLQCIQRLRAFLPALVDLVERIPPELFHDDEHVSIDCPPSPRR